MININRYTLSNGLRVIHDEDNTTQMVALNLLYDVGARDDHSQRQEQRQKLAHRNTPPVSYCAFAQKVL